MRLENEKVRLKEMELRQLWQQEMQISNEKEAEVISLKKQVEEMLVVIDESELPECYGGTNKTEFGKAEVDLKLRQFVLDNLEKTGMAMQVNKTFK